MNDFLEVLEKFKDAVANTKDVILDNLWSFVILFLVYGGVILFFVRLYYRHKSDNLEDWQAKIDRELEEKEMLLQENNQLKQEIKDLKEELESSGYNVYMSKKYLEEHDLDESTIFQ